MLDNDRRQADLLHQYVEALHADHAVIPPTDLDSQTVLLARGLETRLRPPDPDPLFAAALRERIDALMLAAPAVENPPKPARHGKRLDLPKRWLSGSLVRLAVAVVVVTALGGAFWVSRPQPASAQEIIQKARIASTNLAAGGVASFELTKESMAVADVACNQPGSANCTGVTRAEEHTWFTAPGVWRREVHFQTIGGKPTDETLLTVADGKSIWSYDSRTNAVSINAENPDASRPGEMAPYGSELTTLLQQAATCYQPRVVDVENVADRPSYVVSLGASTCPSADTPLANGPQTIWVDKQTFFVLKRVILTDGGQQVMDQEETTSIRYNQALPGTLFTFTAPAGAVVDDHRSRPTPVVTPASDPTSQPVALTLAELRARSAYAIFVPTYLPPGLTPEPPTSDGIAYHDQSGAVALTVVNGPAGCCLAAVSPRNVAEEEQITLPNGSLAHYLEQAPVYGGPILWWNQEGTYIAISGPSLTRDELLKTAASMSKTADLGATVEVTARPTPSPLPTPGVPILRPAWLPEQMTIRQEIQPSGAAGAPEVVLTFDPRPNDAPHDLLTLMERPQSWAETPAPDPQSSVETIGGHAVTMIHRGQGCVSANWVQDGVSLTLTNPYDPPGPPGEVRYTCDQFRKIIESIR